MHQEINHKHVFFSIDGGNINGEKYLIYLSAVLFYFTYFRFYATLCNFILLALQRLILSLPNEFNSHRY